ncbi:hypothetical protein H6G89_10655 [Oscillatoria sp. FACHB-1407]|nr:hypothetical protein [Oscillatoria sp. FACHB-1407]MBD2461509.1 hypothetical protein [Oscillatoria sp. FACHB-1407]
MISLVVKPEVIELPPRAVVKIVANWQDYQAMLKQLGDRSSPRLNTESTD